MASAIGGAFIRVAPVFPGFQSKAKSEAGKLQKTFDRSGSSSGRSFASALGKTVKTGALAVGAAAAAGLGYSLKKGFERLVDIENATASLKGLGHSAQSVQQIMDNALAAVKGTSFGMGEAAKVAASAVASGIKPGQDLERTLRLVGDAATIGQVSMSEMGQIFNKVAAKGKMQATEANMLLERGIPIWEMLADSMGLTTEEVQKLATKGQISFTDFQTAMEEGLGGSALEVGNTTTGALRNIGAAASRLGAVLLAGAFPQIKPLFISIIGVIDRLTDSAKPLGEAIGRILSPAIAGLTKWLDGLKFDSFQSFLASAAPNLGTVASKTGGLNNIMAALAPTGRAVGFVMNTVGSVLGFLGRHMDTVVKLLPVIAAGFIAWKIATFAVNSATERLRWAEVAMAPVYLANNALRLTNILLENRGAAAKNRAALATARETAATSTNTAAHSGNRVAVMLSAAATKWHASVTNGMIRRFAAQRLSVVGSTASLVGHKVAMIASSVATRAAAVATRALNLAMKAGPWMLVIGAIAAVAFGLQQFFTKTDEGRALWAQFTSDIVTAFAPVKAEFERLKPVFAQLVGTFSALASQISGAFASVMSQVVPVVAGLVSTLVSSFVPVVASIVSSLMPAVVSVFGVVAQVIASVVRAVVPLVTALISLLVPVIRVALKIVAWLVQVLAAVLVPVIRGVATAVTWLAESVFKPAWEGIKAAAAVVVTWFQNTLAPGIESGTSAVGGVFSWLYSNVIQPVWNGIRTAISISWAVIQTVFSAIVSVIQTYVVPVFRFFAGVASVVWQIIRAAIQIAWVSIKIVFAAINMFIRNVLAPVFSWLYNNVVKPVFAGIKWVITTWWTGAKIIFSFAVSFIRMVMAMTFSWLYNNVVKPVFAGIKWVITTWWTGAKIIFSFVVSFIRHTLGPVFTWLRDSVITPVWNGIKNAISTAWNFIRDKVFSPLTNAIKNTVPAAFRAGKDAIGKAWDKIKEVAKKPVRFVIETVINKGIIDKFNDIAKFFNVAEKDRPKRVQLPQGFRAGGKVWGPGTETSDSVPAWLSRNEHVWTAREVRGAGGHDAVRAMRDRARRGQMGPWHHGHDFAPGLAKGGTLIDAANWWVRKGARGSRHPAFGGAVRSGHSRNSLHYVDRAVDLNYGPGGQNATEMAFFDRHVAEFKRLFPKIRVIWRAPGHYNHMHIDTANGADIGNFSGAASGGGVDIGSFLNPFTKIKDAIAGQMAKFGPVGKIVGDAGRWLVDKPIQWIKDNAHKVADLIEDAAEGVGNFVGSGIARGQGLAWAAAKGWPVTGARWRALDFIVTKESSWNPRAKNPRSTASGLGQFINDNARFYLGSAPMSKHPVNAQLDAVVRYTQDRYKGLVPAMNFWKKHRHYRDGGPVLYDNGGWLPPGLTATLNATGRPEAVFTERQFADIRAAALGAREGGTRIGTKIDALYAMDMDDALRRLDMHEQKRRVLHPEGV
ncbi:aggregation-promoting factor C-terminal-like domain-containing protein [Brevibacterium gallinarum]|uniref:Tape measure protein n=1 Tax=Brevibacterium gallinarum TaxID=2762220 RepID=A0ABR8WQN4_9MICO|nr:tape measure protein [Brevibacterium gallinarum]MBD8019394.1 tape measure protein [Brevibacterium gallinarum]